MVSLHRTALVAGNGSYILAAYGLDLHSLTITKASPVVVELLFIPLLDVYSIPSRLQLIDWAEALAFILLPGVDPGLVIEEGANPLGGGANPIYLYIF